MCLTTSSEVFEDERLEIQLKIGSLRGAIIKNKILELKDSNREQVVGPPSSTKMLKPQNSLQQHGG